MAELSLTSEHLRIIGYAIGWRLNGPYERTSPPALKEEDRQTLRILFNEIAVQQIACQFGISSVTARLGQSYCCADGLMQLPWSHLELMTDSLAWLLAELADSPTELRVVTGSEPSKALETLGHLRHIIGQTLHFDVADAPILRP